MTGADESPRIATARAVHERLGLEVEIGRMLVVDWVAPTPTRIEGLVLVFGVGGPVSTEQSEAIALFKGFRS